MDTTFVPTTYHGRVMFGEVCVTREEPEFIDVAGLNPGLTCEWFALCDNPAVVLVPHPILIWVPTCTRCLERVDL